MRARWEALHAALDRSVRTLQAEQSFQEAKAHHPALAGFDDAEALVDHLVKSRGDGDAKDRLLAALVTMVQRREHHEVASALLWLGLWPGLSGVYGRRVRHFKGEPDELVAELASAFTELVERVDLTTVHRVAATLVRSTERDVMYRRKRAWLPASHGLRVDHEEVSTSNDADEDDGIASWFDKASLKRWAETEHSSALGLTPGLSFDEDVAVLRAWLEPVVGEDAELLIAVLVLDESRREVGERLGLASDSGRKRVQRAVARLKKHLARSLSRFTHADRFSHPQAP
jgi:DNA-directed RNA polymerase specialized sigma24 family protein